jgi:hypothetical protein
MKMVETIAVYCVDGKDFLLAVKYPDIKLRRALKELGFGTYKWQQGEWIGTISKENLEILARKFSRLNFKPISKEEWQKGVW